MTLEYRHRYTFRVELARPTHEWVCIGPHAGIHVHISDSPCTDAGNPKHYGGIEIHYRSPPDYMADSPPSHDCCPYIKCPCWHDGSSLQCTEKWIPFWVRDPNNHERMFAAIEAEMISRFCEGVESC